jgi:hypothetical protein
MQTSKQVQQRMPMSFENFSDWVKTRGRVERVLMLRIASYHDQRMRPQILQS